MRGRGVLAASLRKELLVAVRSWRVLAYSLFLAAGVLLGSTLPRDDFPHEVAVGQGPLVLLLALGCAFIFGVDTVSREHERGTAPALFSTPASRLKLLGAKAFVPVLAWLVTLSALAASYLSQGLGGQFALLVLIRLLTVTLLFLSVLAILLFLSAAVKGKGAPFAGAVVVLFIFFTSGYLPVGLAEGAGAVSPGHQEHLLTEDLMDGALDLPAPLVAQVMECLIFSALAYWAFRRGEVEP